eukprot:UN00641
MLRLLLACFETGEIFFNTFYETRRLYLCLKVT